MQRMGGFMDAFQIPFEAGFNLFRKHRYPTENLVLPDEDFSRFTFVNPATVSVVLRSGEKLTASSLFPPGFAGTPEAEMTETVLEKLRSSGIDESAVAKIRDFAFEPEKLSAPDVQAFQAWFMQQV
jgi:hypothetical protein